MVISTRFAKYTARAIMAIAIYNCLSAYGTAFKRKPASMGKDYYIVFPKNAWAINASQR